MHNFISSLESGLTFSIVLSAFIMLILLINPRLLLQDYPENIIGSPFPLKPQKNAS